MGVADEDMKLTIDLRPDGVRLHRLSVEAHLPEIDGHLWAQVRTAYLAAKDETGRENAMRLGWGSEGVRLYSALGKVDGIFGVSGPGRQGLRKRLDTLFQTQGGGGEQLPRTSTVKAAPSPVTTFKRR